MVIYSGAFGSVDAANPRPLIVHSEKNMWKGRRRVVNAIRIHKYSHADMQIDAYIATDYKSLSHAYEIYINMSKQNKRKKNDWTN